MSMNSFHARRGRPRPAADHGPPSQAVDRHGLLRVDQLLVAQGLAPSRTAARTLIETGRVTHDGQPVSKPAQELPPDARLEVAADENDRFVSPGALKLEAALTRSGLDVRGAICLDIGQSTGGFTDCLLQAGAKRVLGVELGHGQLHPRLCKEPRCITLEGIDARQLTRSELGKHFPPQGFDLLACDVSAISLKLLLPQWAALLSSAGHVLALVKPQLELSPQGLSNGATVRDTRLHTEIEAHLREAAHAAGLIIIDWFESPRAAGDNNHEYFFHAIRKPGGDTDTDTP